MVCERCILAVKNILISQQIDFNYVVLGEVCLVHDLTNIQLRELNTSLNELGFELLKDEQSKMVQKIKTGILNYLLEQQWSNSNLSDYLQNLCQKEYSGLSQLFSSVTGQTIEHYLVLLRIEKAKELIKYNELNLSEISNGLGYANLSHFSGQFKRITGMSPSQFKKNRVAHSRKSLDKI